MDLESFNKLIERTYSQDETRNLAWSNIVQSKVLLGLREYREAADKAKSALIACQSIHSIQNVTIISDIHSRLTSSAYGASRDVRDLGNMLEEWYELIGLDSRYR